MPKSLDKTKGAKKRKKSPTNSTANIESDGSETKPDLKKKRIPKKKSSLEGITMSKQLTAQVQNKQTIRSRNSKKNTEPRLLGNGKPMPSLAELEAMYATSEDDEEPPKLTDTNITKLYSTPKSNAIIIPDEVKLDLPENLKEITSKVINYLSNKIIDLDDDGPPPPVIPQKKPKKGDKPYIVGCKDRPQVPWAPKTKFGVGVDDYGIDENQIPDEELKKRKKRGVAINMSKSIFNAKSDEIAERLKELDSIEPTRPNSADSNKTIDYEFPSMSPNTNRSRTFSPLPSVDSNETIEYNSSGKSPKTNIPRTFSPLPSTSKDSETILKNDKLFNESLHAEILPTDNSPYKVDKQDDVEVIDIPYETVVIDDSLPNISTSSGKRPYVDLDDDSCIVIEPAIKKKRNSNSFTKSESPPKDDIYGSIDLTQTYDNEVYEINDDDIDSVIAESQAILEKDKKRNKIDAVIAVDPNVIVIEPESLSTIQTAASTHHSTSNANKSNNICHSSDTIERTRVIVPDDTYTNLAPTQSPQEGRSNEIAAVVTNFFNKSQNTQITSRRPNKSTGIIDLTNSSFQYTIIRRLSSWISSIESCLFGGQSFRTSLNNTNDVVVIDDSNSNQNVSANTVSPISPDNQRGGELSSRICPGEPSTYVIFPTSNSECSNSSQSSNSQRGRNTQISVSVSSQPHSSSTVTSKPSTPRRSLGDCPICMDSLANSSVASTMCGHVFCMPCIKAAIQSNGKRCPTCRKVLKGLGYHQLFL